MHEGSPFLTRAVRLGGDVDALRSTSPTLVALPDPSPPYVDEFSFRLNDGNVKVPTMARLDALIDGTIGKRLTYKGLIAKEGN